MNVSAPQDVLRFTHLLRLFAPLVPLKVRPQVALRFRGVGLHRFFLLDRNRKLRPNPVSSQRFTTNVFSTVVRNSSTKASQHRKITLYLNREINHSFDNATNRCRIRHRPPNRLWTKFGALRIKWNSSSWQINRIIHYSSARYSHCILSCHSTSSLGKFIFLLYYDISDTRLVPALNPKLGQ